MTLVALYGAGSGALHAVTGPDHVLSLGPAALSEPNRSFQIGLRWGIGHALGTLLLSRPLLLLARVTQLETFASFGDRLSGFALLLMGLWSLRAARRGRADRERDRRDPIVIGSIHGIGGAGSLLLVLPVLVSGSTETTLLFLAAFSAGSTLAMAVLTAMIARIGAKLEKSVISRVQQGMSGVSIVLGSVWLFG
jgi:nickel/cobalt transporter (NicO) family protein